MGINISGGDEEEIKMENGGELCIMGLLPDRLMVGHVPLKDVILVRVQVWQQIILIYYLYASLPKNILKK
jgi:hypothetical protein